MALVIKNLGKTYKENGLNQTVLNDVSFEMETGETLLITGATGSGKSTLINILGCLESPTSGTYILGDASPLEYNRKKTARFRRDYLGFLFSQPTLLPQLTVLENALVPCLATGFPLKADVAFAKHLLEILKMTEFVDYYPENLNKDQQFRTATVRAFIKRPSLVLADEPVCLLDERLSSIFLEDLLQVQKECSSMLIMTSDVLKFSDHFDRTGTLNKAHLAISGRRDSAPGKGNEVFTYRKPEPAKMLTKNEEQEVKFNEQSNNTPVTHNSQPTTEQLVDEFRRRFQ